MINMKRIKILSPKFGVKYFLIDKEDYKKIKSFKWHLSTRNYIKNHKLGFLHRFILTPKKGILVDHINGDVLDNRKENLRICTPSENQCNRHRQQNNTSGYRGVKCHKTCKRFEAKLQIKNKFIYGGLFKTKEEAAKRYDELAIKYHKKFAKLNFPL